MQTGNLITGPGCSHEDVLRWRIHKEVATSHRMYQDPSAKSVRTLIYGVCNFDPNTQESRTSLLNLSGELLDSCLRQICVW